MDLCHGWDADGRKAPSAVTLLSVLEKEEEGSDLLSHRGQRYKGEWGVLKPLPSSYSPAGGAAQPGQLTCGTAGATSWWQHAQRCRIKNAFQARRISRLENLCGRAQVMVLHLGAVPPH